MSWNIFFGWLIIAKILLLQHNQHFYLDVWVRPSSEEVCSIPLPVLAMIVMRHGKKSVVRVTQRVAPLIPVQRKEVRKGRKLVLDWRNTRQVESITSKPFTRNQHASSLSEQNKSALTDHASHDNHVINWPASIILDRESDKTTRWIKEAVHVRKEGRQSLNQDEGTYTLSHTYDRFLATSHRYHGKNRKRNWTNFFWWRSVIEIETLR